MNEITAVGFDIAKRFFQVHCADTNGTPLLRRKLRRDQVLDFFKELPACAVGIEACSTAHHWGRSLLALGHRGKLPG